MKSMPDKSVDLLITDIPYNEVNRDSNGLRTLDKGIADNAEMDLSVFLSQAIRICDGSFYIFCGRLQYSFLDKFLRDYDISTRCIVWEKTNPSPMNGDKIWLSGIELCSYGKKHGAVFNSKCRNTVIKYKTGQNETEHPTEKPVRIMNDFILTSSNEGDVIFDPFMGSGTTGVACMQLGRNFIGCEIDPKYFAMARKRIEQAAMQELLLA
jgi:DNA modification methylase